MVSSNEYCKELHKRSFGNYDLIKRSLVCGCFYCGTMFPSFELKDEHFIQEKNGERTAQCPYCYTDSIICDADETEINPELIEAMHKIYF